MFAAGEDIAFSYALQQHGINTYVPPHPITDQSLWGSLPEKSKQYGIDSVATGMFNFHNFKKSLTYFKNKGFKLII